MPSSSQPVFNDLSQQLHLLENKNYQALVKMIVNMAPPSIVEDDGIK